MTKIRKEFVELAKSLEFQLDDIELDKIEQEYLSINERLDLIKQIDTTNIEPTNFVHPILVDPELREDVDYNYNSHDVFDNCQTFKEHFVVIKNEK